jgi:hypothetical protein
LTQAGFGKRHQARALRMKHLRFEAPALEHDPLISFGRVETLGDTPWMLFEVSMTNLDACFPVLQQQFKRICSRKSGQIFAPTNKAGELTFGYFFARSSSPTITRSIARVRGVTEFAATYSDAGNFRKVVTVPEADVAKMIDDCAGQKRQRPQVDDFVQVLSGPAKGYCGTITARNVATITFLTGRTFTVNLGAGAAKILSVPKSRRAFFGELPKL